MTMLSITIRDSNLIMREFPVCEGGGESKVLRGRTSPASNQLRATPVKAWEPIIEWTLLGSTDSVGRNPVLELVLLVHRLHNQTPTLLSNLQHCTVGRA